MTQTAQVNLTPPQAAVFSSYQRVMAGMQLEAQQLATVYRQEGAATVLLALVHKLNQLSTQFLRDCESGIVIAQTVPEVPHGIIQP